MSKRTKKQNTEVENLALMTDEEIDTSDIPEITDWSNAVVGKYYRPIKKTDLVKPGDGVTHQPLPLR